MVKITAVKHNNKEFFAFDNNEEDLKERNYDSYFSKSFSSLSSTDYLTSNFIQVDFSKKTITVDIEGIDKIKKERADEAPAREMVEIRRRRDTLLRETDHFGLADVTMSDDMKTYRQALRDIPASNTVYADVTWPPKP